MSETPVAVPAATNGNGNGLDMRALEKTLRVGNPLMMVALLVLSGGSAYQMLGVATEKDTDALKAELANVKGENAKLKEGLEKIDDKVDGLILSTTLSSNAGTSTLTYMQRDIEDLQERLEGFERREAGGSK
jgi:hypothetical protein